MTRPKMLAAGAMLLAALATAAPIAAQDFTLSIIHTNDIHSRVDQVMPSGSFCTPQNAAQDRCVGGYARLATKIRELRATRANPILLDAGDAFQGTLFYTMSRSDAVKPFLAALGYDAMTLGNHEFDDGPAELAKFLDGFPVPVVAANVDAAREPRLAGKWAPHRILEIGGQRIGVIGLTTAETPVTSSPGPTIGFLPHAESLRREVAALQAAGVNKIVALTHVGAHEDAALAAAVDGVDIYVGGHSHTLLHNGTDPRKEGSYPIVVRTPSGAPALIVHAYYGGLFLGDLQVAFDTAGIATSWTGDTIAMDARVARDPAIQAMVDRMAVPLAELRAREVGAAIVTLDGSAENCRFRECNLGNLVADAMLRAAAPRGARVAIQNGGGIRTSIPAGPVTLGQVLEVLPFSNMLATFDMTGADIVAALEQGVGRADNPRNEGTGRFPQVAGLRYSFEPGKPAGSRLHAVEIRGADGGFAPIDPAATYTVVTNDFLRKGGDGYAMFRDKARNAYDAGPNLEDVLVDHLRALNGPVAPALDGRITRIE
jgi:5'-nucleotidase/UDP-sugar diphosphatase